MCSLAPPPAGGALGVCLACLCLERVLCVYTYIELRHIISSGGNIWIWTHCLCTAYFQQQCFPSGHFVIHGGCEWVTTVLSVTCQCEKLLGREIAADLKAPCLRYLLNTVEMSSTVWGGGNTHAYLHLFVTHILQMASLSIILPPEKLKYCVILLQLKITVSYLNIL